MGIQTSASDHRRLEQRVQRVTRSLAAAAQAARELRFLGRGEALTEGQQALLAMGRKDLEELARNVAEFASARSLGSLETAPPARAPRKERRSTERAQPAEAAPESPPPPPAARAASPIGGGEDAGEDLCADYEPAPRPKLGLPIPLPPSFRDDPGFRLADPVVLGATARPPQAGTIGRLLASNRRVSLNLNESFCLGAFSVPGGGKTYLCNSILQMALRPLPYLNEVPRPLCGVSFHYQAGGGYEPEALSAVHPNQNVREVLDLIDHYGALPQGLEDVVVLCPKEQVAAMRARHPHIQVFPILFAPGELGSEGFRALLGVNDDKDDSLYVRRLRQQLSALRGELSLSALRAWAAELPGQAAELVEARLGFVEPYLAEGYPLRRLIKPGRLIIVDIRDEWLPRKDALVLFTLLSTILTRRADPAEPHLLLCFDEAHRYMEHRGLRAEIERLARERRHLHLSLLLASQDPLGVPVSLLGLLDMIALGQVQSDEWIKKLGKANALFRQIDASVTSKLGAGKMLLWSERVFTEGLERRELLPISAVQVRPQCGHHGGATKTAVR